MSETIRALILSDEYESDWWYVIQVPDPKYSYDTFKSFMNRDQVYDLPKELVVKYESAIKARNEVDAELIEIVREGRGKVEPVIKSPGLPF